MQVVCIGAGFGGLALGIRLQARGYSVTLIDKQSTPGGHAAQLKKGGYTFDMGPSLITAPSLLEELFALAGEKLENYLSLIALEPFYRVYFYDGTFIDYTGHSEQMKMTKIDESPESLMV